MIRHNVTVRPNTPRATKLRTGFASFDADMFVVMLDKAGEALAIMQLTPEAAVKLAQELEDNAAKVMSARGTR